MQRWSFVLIPTLFVVMSLSLSAAEPVAWPDNLFLNARAGFEKPTGEDSTGFAALGFNWGIPLNAESDGVAWGAQVGGDLTFREDNPEWNQTLGLFCRKVPAVGDNEAAAAALFDYTHTAFHNDVWAFRPVLGTTLGKQDAIGVTAVIELNEDSSSQGAAGFCQECEDRLEFFWNRDWDEKLASEWGVGYQFGEVDETIFNWVMAYSISPAWDVAALGSINTAGNYDIGGRVSFHFGATSRHDVIHNIDGAGKARFTPFPKQRPLEVTRCHSGGLAD